MSGNVSVDTVDGVYIQVLADDPVFMKVVDKDGSSYLRCPFCKIIDSQMDITGVRPHFDGRGNECRLPLERVGLVEALYWWVNAQKLDVFGLSYRLKVRPYWKGVLRHDDAKKVLVFIEEQRRKS